MLVKVDSFIIEKIFQKISDAIWRIAPISCYTIGAQLAVIYVVMMSVASGIDIWKQKKEWWLNFILIPMVLFIGYTTHRRCMKNEDARLLGKVTLSIARLAWMPTRLMWLVLMLIDSPLWVVLLIEGDYTLESVLMKLSMVTIWAAIYFEVCVGRPTRPLKRRVLAYS